MKKILRLAIEIRLWRDGAGHDLIEYVMIAAFLAVASSLLVSDFSQNISLVLSKVTKYWLSRS